MYVADADCPAILQGAERKRIEDSGRVNFRKKTGIKIIERIEEMEADMLNNKIISYSSGNNTQWLSVEEIRERLRHLELEH